MTILPVFSGKECKKLHLAFLCKKNTNQGQSLLCKIFLCTWFSIIFCVIYIPIFLCFTRHLLFPSDCILNEICLNSVCIVKKKKNDLKGYSPVHSLKPSCFHQLFLWVAQSSFFLQRFMGASSIIIKKMIPARVPVTPIIKPTSFSLIIK